MKAKTVKRKRVEITLERERSLIVGHRKTSIKGWYEGCRPGVRTVTLDETDGYDHTDDQSLCQVRPISLWRRIGGGLAHLCRIAERAFARPGRRLVSGREKRKR